MSGRRQLAVFLSALWVAGWMFVSYRAPSDYHAGDFLLYQVNREALRIIAVVPVVLLWGIAWVMNAINEPAQAARRDRIGLAIAGAVFVLLRISSDYIPRPTRFKERTFVIALALAAGAAGGFVPGVIAGEGKRPSVAVRAAGAIGLAVFIIIVFYRFLA